MPDVVSVTLVLPAYNEDGIIADTVHDSLEALESFLPTGSFEVIVADNGSTDDTAVVVDELAAEDDRVWRLDCPSAGRGHALNAAIQAANGETVAYMDVDMATDLRHLEELVQSVREEGYEVVTGSRYLDKSVALRDVRRLVPSHGFNWLTRWAVGSRLRDHQCGFKAFDRARVLELLPAIEDEHWFWDTELLVKAQKRGYAIKEFPVEWEEKGDSKVDLVKDLLGMGSQLLRTTWELRLQPKITRRRSVAAGVVLVALAVVLMTYWVDVDDLVAAFRAADYRVMAIAGVVYLSSLLIRGVRYRDILGALGHPGDTWFLTGAVSISQTANFVVPARAGDAVRAYVIKARRGIPYPTGFASLTIERVFDLAVIALIAGGGIVIHGTGRLQAILGTANGPGGSVSSAAAVGFRVALVVAILALLVAGAIVASARIDRNILPRVLRRLSSDSYVSYVEDVLGQFVGDLQIMGRDRRILGRTGMSTAAIWGLDIVTGLLVLSAFGVDIGSPTVVVAGTVAIAIGTLAKVVPLTPGGIGLYEGVFTFILVSLTPVTLAVAIGAAIVDHAMKNLVTILVAAAAVGKYQVSLVTAIDEGTTLDREGSRPAEE